MFQAKKNFCGLEKRMDTLKKTMVLNDDSTVTVYRGQNTESTKEDKAFSWTLSKKTAQFFANRFNKGAGKIVTKRVKPDEIIDYLDYRGESEVIIMPKKFE